MAKRNNKKALKIHKNRNALNGVQYVVNSKGTRKSVLIDLDIWGEVWEDISDVLVSASRRNEPLIPWKQLKQ